MNDNYYLRAVRELQQRMEDFGYATRIEEDRNDDFWNTVEAYPESYSSFKQKEEVEMPDGYDSGRNFATALAEMFIAKPGVTYSKVVNVARKFAAWEGYRGLEDGLSYISGFTDGFFASQPKQIQEKAE